MALDHRSGLDDSDSIEKMFETYLLEKWGQLRQRLERKHLTLKQFESKYTSSLMGLAEKYKSSNVWKQYESLSDSDQSNDDLIKAMRQLDVNVNINWPLSHYKSAVRYLASKDGDAPATGGTNWQKYLPPRFQKRIFYPALWNSDELSNWGKGWVEEVLSDSIKVKGE